MKTWNHTLQTARKELTHVLRDRRTVMSTQLYALMGPVLLVAVLSAMTADADRAPQLGVIGAQNAPELIDALKTDGVQIEPCEERPLTKAALSPYDAVLSIPDDFRHQLDRRKRVALELFHADTADSRRTAETVHRVVRSHAGRQETNELLKRGISPTGIQPLRLQSINLSKSRRTALIATMLMMYLVIAPLVASAGAAVDTATGERSRGTLSLMRLQPISPLAWVTGKWLVVATFAWAGAVATAALCVVAIQALVPQLASSVNLSAESLGIISLASLPMAMLSAIVNFVLALQARSTMEAQTRLSLVAVVPAGIGLWAITQGTLQGLPIPLVHEVVGLSGWLSGQPFPLTATGISAAISIGIVAVGLYWSSRRIVSEAYLSAV